MKKAIAIIGQGFVGGSLTTVFAERGVHVYVHDKTRKIAPGGRDVLGLEKTFDGKTIGRTATIDNFVGALEQHENFSGVYFVCLPTPMYEDGEADLSIVEGVLEELANAASRDTIAVVKSTIPPGSTESWNKKFEGRLHVVFNPEFLTEANAVDDMRNQNRIVLGGPRPWINTVKRIFQSAFSSTPIIKTSSTTAEMVKYFTNVHLAARVVLSCELSQVCETLDSKGLNIDYDKVLEYASYDERLGGTHMNVPGQDGIPGARGHCFPKDLNALKYLAKQIGVKSTVMDAIWEKNLEVVKPEHRDWEKMQGRAVSKKKK